MFSNNMTGRNSSKGQAFLQLIFILVLVAVVFGIARTRMNSAKNKNAGAENDPYELPPFQYVSEQPEQNPPTVTQMSRQVTTDYQQTRQDVQEKFDKLEFQTDLMKVNSRFK